METETGDRHPLGRKQLSRDWAIPPVYAVLTAVILLGAVLRLYGLGERSLWYDECASLYLSHYVNHPGQLFDPAETNEPPMMAVLAWFWYGAVQAFSHFPVTSEQNDFLIRLMPCLFGIAAIPLVFLVARRIFGDAWPGVIAAFLFAISPFQIYYAQELRIYAFYILVCLFTVWAMFNALERDKFGYWAAMTLGMSTLMYSHYNSVWTIFSLNLFFLTVARVYRRVFWKWVAANAAMMILIAPALYLAWSFNQIILTIKYAWYPNPTWKTGLITFKDFFAGYGPSAWAYWPLFGLAAALFLAGLWGLRRRWPVASFLLVVTCVPIACNVALWSHRHFSFYEHRLFIFSGVVATLGIAYGLRTLRHAALTALALAAFTALSAPGLRDYYEHRLHPIEMHRLAIYDKVDFRSAAAYIQTHLQPGDVVGHASHFMVYPMLHYLNAEQYRFGMSDLDRQVYIDTFGNVSLLDKHGLMPVPVAEATKHARRVWFTESYGVTFEYKPQTEPIRAWLDTHWNAVERHTFDGLYVTLYERKEPMGESGQ